MITLRRYALISIPVVLVLASACTASPTPTPIPAADDTVGDPWAATASEHRLEVGEQFDYDCPADGQAYIVWGVDVYTDDSSVCTAAVHAGLITLGEGGTVTIEMREGEDSYEGSERNGVTTSSYGQWGGSFVIVEP
jgi:LCCL domain-containing protein